MPTNDFVEDAVDSLDADPDLAYFMVVCRPKRPHHSCYAYIETRAQLAWLRRRINHELNAIEHDMELRGFP